MSASRRDRNRLNSSGSYSLKSNLPYWFTKFVWNKPNMGGVTEKAKLRLAFLEFYQVVKDVSVVCKAFKISRTTFYKWKDRFDTNDLRSLEDESKAPHTKREGILTFRQEQDLVKFRQDHIRQGKVKLSVMYKNKYGVKYSAHQFQKVIEKYNLYFDKVKAEEVRTKKDKGRGNKKIRIDEVNPKDFVTDEKPFFFATDTIVLYLPWGIKRYIITAYDHFHKIGYARVYKSKSSLNAFDFLFRLNILIDGKIAAILSDNGSEFAKYFEEACKRLKITHIFTRVRTPQDNPMDERFNRTVKEEFMEINDYFEEYLAEKDLVKANKELTEWLVFYNFTRPHQALNYLTPMQYTCSKVSAMYPASTNN
jgi:transposase